MRFRATNYGPMGRKNVSVVFEATSPLGAKHHPEVRRLERIRKSGSEKGKPVAVVGIEYA